MQESSPVIPHGLNQILWPALAMILGWVGGWITRRKREPVELAHLTAQTRQISISTDVQLITAVSEAIAKVERLQDERDHWERRAESLQRDNDLLNIEVTSMDNQMRKLSGYIQAKGLHPSDLDKPKSQEKDDARLP